MIIRDQITLNLENGVTSICIQGDERDILPYYLKLRDSVPEVRGGEKTSSKTPSIVSSAVSVSQGQSPSFAMSREDTASFKRFYQAHQHEVHIDKAVLAASWLRSNRQITDFTVTHFMIMLISIGERLNFDCKSAITNAKWKRGFFVRGPKSGIYHLTAAGEAHVAQLKL